ncbi:carbamoyltransferase HypF [Streptomyces sp. UNOC14_S4]|uniref:carbamoyltransferase HypF n=1 Tax=Streptomyces sp. UNOC14_S4 TaxID=2872340 RepID=UPI001E3EEE2A|nr:carbamoyltransferase HypF [Streptomyces sp. UNOC14_S4]MCC3766299.1 carbamoyltransferase HypF [Streptomyces sp. UNOC14_S4]
MEGERVARVFTVYGRVQGVGFRPFVHRVATRLGLDGWVLNAGGHVELSVAGSPRALSTLLRALRDDAPPLARVRRVGTAALAEPSPAPGSGFTVRGSSDAPGRSVPREIPPDAATCDACVRELFDPADRRFRYPFVNCADCGPRATVIEDLPYDRERTTMRHFALCAPCAAEYADPGDRRFHAEPVACPACGPQLSWDGLSDEAALRAAVTATGEGAVIAVKGLGGYQLVCDATNADAVARLRERKRRPAKPFAVMVRDVEAVHRLARLPSGARTTLTSLTSPARPVVLLTARRRSGVVPAVHPGTDHIGLFLPTTGLHHLLLHDLGRPLVVTSGNRSGEPIAIDDAAARNALADVTDGFLSHDRPIRARYDDSVVRPAGRAVLTVRRARGLAPAPLPLPTAAAVPLVAAGAQLKHTFALAEGTRVLLGPHTGDLEDAGTLEAFEAAYADLVRLTGIEPRAVAHDLHPGYLSTQWARALPVERRIAVQHHHAHVAACAAEHGVRGPFIGVAYDGLGFGDDGTLWGGEILVADLARYRRVGRFATAPLPGGAAAVRRPARMAMGYLYGAEPLGTLPPPASLIRSFTQRFDPREVRAVRTMVERGVNCPRASSAGRLFDAAASLLGFGDDATYEGQAAVALETAAGNTRVEALPWRLVPVGGVWVYDPVPTLVALLERAVSGERASWLAAAFHKTVAEATGALVERAVQAGAPRTVCLSGGCFQNVRLLTDITTLLRSQGLRVHVGSAVPVNDGGISYGQAAVAAVRIGVEGE